MIGAIKYAVICLSVSALLSDCPHKTEVGESPFEARINGTWTRVDLPRHKLFRIQPYQGNQRYGTLTEEDTKFDYTIESSDPKEATIMLRISNPDGSMMIFDRGYRQIRFLRDGTIKVTQESTNILGIAYAPGKLVRIVTHYRRL